MENERGRRRLRVHERSLVSCYCLERCHVGGEFPALIGTGIELW
jgi:hypothetical protein